MSVKEQIT